MTHLDVEKLYNEKIITDRQRDAILARLVNKQTPPVSAPDRGLITVLTTLATLLIVIGAIIVVSTHWDEVTASMKSAACMVMLALAWIGCWLLREKKPAVSEGLGLLGSCMWGVNIMVNVVLYDIPGSFTDWFFIFFIGILPIPFLLRQRILIGVVAASSFVLLSLMLYENSDSILSLYPYARQTGTAMLLNTGLMLVWWLVGEFCRRSRGVCAGYYWIAIPSFIAFIGTMQGILLYGSGNELPMQLWSLAVPLLIIICSTLCKPVEGTRAQLCAVAICCALLQLVALALGDCPAVFHDMLGLLSCSAFALALTAMGVKCNRRSWINYAALMMVCVFFNLMHHISRSVSDSGFIFIAVGVSVLAFAFLLEGQRRRLIKKVTERTALAIAAPKAAPVKIKVATPPAADSQPPAEDASAAQAAESRDK